MLDREQHAERSFVLLHGGGLRRWAWSRVTPLLQLPSLALDLPGRNNQPGDVRRLTIADCTNHVIGVIERAGVGQIVLVTHSYTGVLAAPIVPLLGERVVHLALVGACVPSPGCSVLELDIPRCSVDLMSWRLC